jgi:hypothetical protein
MKQIPSCEPRIYSDYKEILLFLWNPKIRYRVHKSPQLVSVLDEINTIHCIPTYSRVYKIHFNIIVRSIPMHFNRPLPYGFSD